MNLRTQASGRDSSQGVVLLTFTNLAAEEMKGRLRDRIKQLSTGSLGSTLEADPRLRSEADKEQLMMLLEDAPIGTIDSFFTRLIRPHLASLGELMDAEIVTDAQREHWKWTPLMHSGHFHPTRIISHTLTLNYCKPTKLEGYLNPEIV